jgi:hypothetical protein
VDDRRREMVLWMCNYPTELMACSIYRVLKRWCPIRRDCASGREEEMSHCGDHWLRSYGGYWAVSTARNDVVNGLRRGITRDNGGIPGDDRTTTSPGKWA